MKYRPGYRAIICDVCGRKVRVKDTVKITDKYNTQYGLIVCKKDADKTNPQNKPIYVRPEKTLSDPTYVRPELPALFATYATIEEALGGTPSSDSPPTSAPGQVLGLEITGATLTSVSLFWLAPLSSGTSEISGYLIERLDVFECTWHTITTTSTADRTYIDTTDIYGNTTYTYRVSAVSGAGTGNTSEIASGETPSS